MSLKEYRENKLLELRKGIFMTARAFGEGHLASSFSCLEILYSLYIDKKMNYDVNNPDWVERDVFVLSKGHAALALYNILAEVGFFDKKLLKEFCKPNSILGGEPDKNKIPGVEASTGSLGHGLSYGVGVALARKLDARRGKIVVLLGDGECQEGSIWEAAIMAAKHKLNNLCVVIDANKLQKMTSLEQVMGEENWVNKWNSFGWNVVEVDGHDVDALNTVFDSFEKNEERPLAIIAHTLKGKGVSVMENNPDWHYRMPKKKDMKKFIAELDIKEEEL